MPDYAYFIFSLKALEIFKKIFLSCTAKKDVLRIAEPFLKMKSGVSLADTKVYVQTGSETIFAYKLFNPEKIISVEDVILAFSGEPHWNKMEKLYQQKLKSSDPWTNLFPLEEYLISHIIKPVTLPNGNTGFAIMDYLNDLYPLQFWGIQSFDEIYQEMTQLIHFGLVVYQTCDRELLLKIIAQNDILTKVLKDFKLKKIFYTQQELVEIYERNIEFYDSLKT